MFPTIIATTADKNDPSARARTLKCTNDLVEQYTTLGGTDKLTSKVCPIETFGKYGLGYERHDEQELCRSSRQRGITYEVSGHAFFVKKSFAVAMSSCLVPVLTYNRTGKPSSR